MFHHLTILNADGSENTAEEVVQDIGGPLCFQGKCPKIIHMTYSDTLLLVRWIRDFLRLKLLLQVITLQKKQSFLQ